MARKDCVSREAAIKAFQEKYPNDKCGVINATVVLESLPPATPTFEGMTNGEVIMALFPKASITELGGRSTIVVANDYKFNATWWNAPYKAEREAKNE